MVPNHQPDLGMTTEKSQVISGRAGWRLTEQQQQQPKKISCEIGDGARFRVYHVLWVEGGSLDQKLSKARPPRCLIQICVANCQ